MGGTLTRADLPLTKDGRFKLSRDRVFRGGKKRPAWWAEAVLLYTSTELSQPQIAERLGKKLQTVTAALNSPWAKERRRDIEARTRERMVEAGVSPILQAQLEAPAAMGRIIQASKDATKPLEIASVCKDVLAIAGFVTDRRQSTNLTMTLQGKIKEVSDADLEAFATQGIVPESVRGMLALPEPKVVDHSDG